MPIMADALAVHLDEDAEAFAALIVGEKPFHTLTVDGTIVELYGFTPNNKLDPERYQTDRHLLLGYVGEKLVYSCFFDAANINRGRRIVQTEVRSTLPKLANTVMRFFLSWNDVIRTDIATTFAGLAMWKNFCDYNPDLFFYAGELDINANTATGAANQDPAQPEQLTSLRTINEVGAQHAHDNKRELVIVIYASNERML